MSKPEEVQMVNLAMELRSHEAGEVKVKNKVKVNDKLDSQLQALPQSLPQSD